MALLSYPKWALVLFDFDGCTVPVKTSSLQYSESICEGSIAITFFAKVEYKVEILKLADSKVELNSFEIEWSKCSRADAIDTAKNCDQTGGYIDIQSEGYAVLEDSFSDDVLQYSGNDIATPRHAESNYDIRVEIEELRAAQTLTNANLVTLMEMMRDIMDRLDTRMERKRYKPKRKRTSNEHSEDQPQQDPQPQLEPRQQKDLQPQQEPRQQKDTQPETRPLKDPQPQSQQQPDPKPQQGPRPQQDPQPQEDPLPVFLEELTPAQSIDDVASILPEMLLDSIFPVELIAPVPSHEQPQQIILDFPEIDASPGIDVPPCHTPPPTKRQCFTYESGDLINIGPTRNPVLVEKLIFLKNQRLPTVKRFVLAMMDLVFESRELETSSIEGGRVCYKGTTVFKDKLCSNKLTAIFKQAAITYGETEYNLRLRTDIRNGINAKCRAKRSNVVKT